MDGMVEYLDGASTSSADVEGCVVTVRGDHEFSLDMMSVGSSVCVVLGSDEVLEIDTVFEMTRAGCGCGSVAGTVFGEYFLGVVLSAEDSVKMSGTFAECDL